MPLEQRLTGSVLGLPLQGCRSALLRALLAVLAWPLIASPPVCAQPRLTWQELPPLPIGRGGHASAWLANRLLIVGGSFWRDEQKHWMSSVESLDPAGRRWSHLGELPVPVGYAAYGTYRDALYLAGGSDGDHDLASVWAIRVQSDGLHVAPCTPLPEPRIYARGAVIGDTLYVFGGARDHADLSTATNTLFAARLTGTRLQWRRFAPLPGAARAVCAMAACQNRLYVFGGCRLDPDGKPLNLADAYCYDPGDNRWTRLCDAPRAARGWDAVALDDRYIALLGGYTASAEEAASHPPGFGFTDRVLLYDIRRDRYEAAGELPLPIIGLEPVRTDRVLYAVGGEDVQRHRSARAFRAVWR